MESLLSWERGLKFDFIRSEYGAGRVAPLVGAWIEIIDHTNQLVAGIVAPLVGAWIEMYYSEPIAPHVRSLLSWERGLKYVYDAEHCEQ